VKGVKETDGQVVLVAKKGQRNEIGQCGQGKGREVDGVGKDERSFKNVWGVVRQGWEVSSYPWASWQHMSTKQACGQD